MIKKAIFGIIFALGLVYILWPGPSSINNFSDLPGSLKSDEPGDTWQNPNIAGYYTNAWRAEATNFYKTNFSYIKVFGITIPPIRLNHPPEYAYQYIRDQQYSTYLEEFVYPLRDSFFVNGYEPYNQNGKPFKIGIAPVQVNKVFYNSKVTVRFYPSKWFFRLFVYSGIWLGFYVLYLIVRNLWKGRRSESSN